MYVPCVQSRTLQTHLQRFPLTGVRLCVSYARFFFSKFSLLNLLKPAQFIVHRGCNLLDPGASNNEKCIREQLHRIAVQRAKHLASPLCCIWCCWSSSAPWHCIVYGHLLHCTLAFPPKALTVFLAFLQRILMLSSPAGPGWISDPLFLGLLLPALSPLGYVIITATLIFSPTCSPLPFFLSLSILPSSPTCRSIFWKLFFTPPLPDEVHLKKFPEK